MDFLDCTSFAKRERNWQLKSHVKAYDDKYDQRRMGTNGNQFEQAIEFVLQSTATAEMPKFVPRGSLPVEYKDAPADPVMKMRKTMGDDVWFEKFANSQERHQQMHMYETLGDCDKEEEDVDGVEQKSKSTKQSCKRSRPQS